MKKILVLFICFWVIESQAQVNSSDPGQVLIILLEDDQFPDKFTYAKKMKDLWRMRIDTSEVISAENSMTLQKDSNLVAIMHIGQPLSGKDLDFAAKNAWFWPEADSVIRTHASYIVLAIPPGKSSTLSIKTLMTKFATGLLSSTRALAVFNPNQKLLFPTDMYLEDSQAIRERSLPVNLWLFFLLSESKGKSSGLTYGLEEFGLLELEVLSSDQEIEEVYDLLYATAEYCIKNDLRLKSGETVGFTPEQKIPIILKKSPVSKKKVARLLWE